MKQLKHNETKQETKYLSIKSWHICKCGGETSHGCGRYFSMFDARSDTDGYVVCPYCHFKN